MAKSRKSDKDSTETVEEAVVLEEMPSIDEPEQVDINEESAVDEASDDTDLTPNSDIDEPEVAEEGAPETPIETPVAARRSSGFVPMLLGGAIAAAAGFGAARYPDQWPFSSTPAIDPVAQELTALSGRVDGLETATTSQSQSLAALEGDDSTDRLRGELSGEMAQLRTQYEAMSAQLTDLENRLHTVEKLPQGSVMVADAAAATAYERELGQMREMLDAELAKISSAKEDAQTLEVSAAETAKAAAARAATSRLMAALATGRPFDDALFDLTENAGVEAPASLASFADKGISTQSALQDSFPDTARAALDAAIRQAVSDGTMSRTTAFLRTQLGTRSLTPKEGDDPDAILSRAEAALKAGELPDTLSELASMPDAAQPALADWIATATARIDALAAAEALSQQVNSN